MLEINELNQAWDDSYLSDASPCFADYSSEGPLWDGLDTYLDESCVGMME